MEGARKRSFLLLRTSRKEPALSREPQWQRSPREGWFGLTRRIANRQRRSFSALRRSSHLRDQSPAPSLRFRNRDPGAELRLRSRTEGSWNWTVPKQDRL